MTIYITFRGEHNKTTIKCIFIDNEFELNDGLLYFAVDKNL